ncbi:30S ribosomal protein S20 [Candidatus Giovannonibacteria bacterium RIFCSPLOWO2_02_FULL_45_14]|uniref:Small ribosomal subunit protein bS20 n=2 Tax=Parcubacteria group TaxID=1794811 RepID=A0A0H4T7U9_9BACT|nr:ribosomal protein S20, small subunit ribosomal protein S20 [uncultured Parcubacteria bacterium Rifle_16ft_4_minimus_37658]OGF68984.1 MAG: 30S ribosomal protein S20 [Candidatus Giovannonibacteria bacterium RIFCSPHIGHO2_02_FULL_44_31]OGF76256.1 MAG: 30S ribosomal protein S20 [Candidatus Giovannonibacteria bacterium RIFCSPHIGHO2_12_FULL_44_29]OGF91152.1 MAG: 30S ribosomal protein S20 [Candidatus Giovannonibacteria bacterium RIFCSPLOWO2_02_FULL_45_14]OGF93611.1 MAG: 30S ribosomal protein S20 [Ca
MPITKSAKKAHRKSLRNKERNLGRKASLTKALKTFSRLLKDKKLDEARNYFPTVQKALDKAVKQRILNANTASRKKSRLSKRIKA